METSMKCTTRWLIVLGIGLLAAACGTKTPQQKSFDSPEQAVAAMKDLIGKHDDRATAEVFGPGSADLFASGDVVKDREDGERVKAMIAAGVAFAEVDDNTRVALFGNDAWPWPIPLVKTEGKWRFDTAAGREELLNRRIGRDELLTLTSLHAFVDAQREYAGVGRDGNPPAFAQRFHSTEGKHDGLFWPAAEGEPRSPLGDLLAGSEHTGTEPSPYNGYYYRILNRQGKNAPGGEKSYVDAKGLMTGGFAVVAWPAKYGNSGVMTFLMNQRGIVYQKDLGKDTATVAAAIESFDPDKTWSPTGDELGTASD